VASAALVANGIARAATTSESNVDRPGADLKSIELQQARPGLCRKACDEEAQCRAYTYVKPGVQGPRARCYLKSSVPPAVSNTCCISGVKATAGQTRDSGQKPNLQNYPSGAELWRWDKMPLKTDFAAKGQSIHFHWNVTKVPNAKGVAWQVSQAPFPNFEAGESDLHPHSVVASGNAFETQGSVVVDFAKLSGTGGLSRKTKEGSNQGPAWYVRVLPLRDPQTIVGQPSNVIGVYEEKTPTPSGPDFPLGPEGQWYVQPGIPLRLTGFEFTPYRIDNHWPAGCEVYKGAGYNKTPWGWAGGAVTDAFDWTSQAYADVKGYVVTGVVTAFPFVPKEAAAIALDAALASAGIPPSVPNLDQLMSSGADYLASQMADELAAQVPAGSEAAQLGKEKLRRQLQQETSQALRDTAKKARAALVKKTKYCIDMEYPPIIKLTIQNVGSESYQNVEIKIDYRDPNLKRDDYLLRPFKGFTIDQIGPGESQTIPVDIFSHMNVRAVPEDPSTPYSEKDIYHWMQLYQASPLRFSVRGGQGIKYRAKAEHGQHLEEVALNDGTGFSYESPSRTWWKEAFVGP
jgi:hypothetical protein